MILKSQRNISRQQGTNLSLNIVYVSKQLASHTYLVQHNRIINVLKDRTLHFYKVGNDLQGAHASTGDASVFDSQHDKKLQTTKKMCTQYAINCTHCSKIMISVLCSMIFCKQLSTKNNNNMCNQELFVDNTQYMYCQKAQLLNRININKRIVLSKYSGNIFIYNDIVKQADISLDMYDTNSFAVFGVNSQSQLVQNSIVNVTIVFRVVQGSLICHQCDARVYQSTLIFIADGERLSVVLQQALTEIIIHDSLLQFRLNCYQCSGLIHCVNRSLALQIVSTQLIGHSYRNSLNDSNLIHSILVPSVIIQTHSFSICTNLINHVGLPYLLQYQFTQQPDIQCKTICNNKLIPTYGICLPDLLLGQISTNGTLVCESPFIYNGEFCICKHGYLLNVSRCVDIVNQLSYLELKLDSSVNTLYNDMQGNVSALDTQIQLNYRILDLSIARNYTNLHNLLTNVNTSLSSQINSVNKSLHNITGQLQVQSDSLRRDLNSTNNTLWFNTNSLNKTVNQIQVQYTDQQIRIENINKTTQTQLQQQYNNLNILNNTLNNYMIQEQKIENVQNSNINNLGAQQQQLQQKINVASGSIVQLKNEVAANHSLQSKLISDTSAQISTLQSNLLNINTAISKFKNQSDQINSKQNTQIPQLFEKSKQFNTIIYNHQNQLNSLRTRINSLKRCSSSDDSNWEEPGSHRP
ncbi:Hypothetical_protein [Hexamita inflata]|uniref:Hypothetical_protein n=1 Tax=Hexamita inflata TaxID=28002 RepID=A0AA86RAM7_9EUKA|nr:Hypothetical protein HINF_LOCUS58753 [Hexamita inflata]